MDSEDPDAIPLSSPAAIAYAAQAEVWGAEAPEPVERVSYGDDRGQRLNVYAPARARDLPLLLFFHGGAWINGHLGWLSFMAPAVLALPAVFVAASYRLAPRCRWPAQEEDARAALGLVHACAADWGADLERIVIAGHSAGGQLAALVALKGDRPPLAACMPVSAPLDLRYGDVPIESDAGRVYRYLLADRAHDADASPIGFVGGNRLPFHLMWGEKDLDRVRDSDERMVAALEHASGPVSHRILADASHFDTHLALKDPGHDWYRRLAELSGPVRAQGEAA